MHQPETGTQGKMMSKTLLLADDSVVIQKLVGLSFANEDVEIITADNGDDAVSRALEAKPDLVIADVIMPGKSGYEVCEAIKQAPELAHTPVLLLTGTFEAFDEKRAASAGAVGHITKPFDAQALIERVTGLLNAPAEPTPPSSELEIGGGTPTTDDDFDFFDDDISERLNDASSAVAAPANDRSSPAGGSAADLDTVLLDTDDTVALLSEDSAGSITWDDGLDLDTSLDSMDPIDISEGFDLGSDAPNTQKNPGQTSLAGSNSSPTDLDLQIGAEEADELALNPNEDLLLSNDVTADISQVPADSAFDISASDLEPGATDIAASEPPTGTAPVFAPDVSEVAPAAQELDPGMTSVSAVDPSPELQARLHETLEKVAWEAFSEISEQVVKQVLERVEAIAWEVIPQMSETLVREEIRKMKGEDESAE